MSDPESSAKRARHRFPLWLAISSALGFGGWWIASLLLHTALFGILTVVVPKQSTELPAPDELNMAVRPDQVKEVVEDIRSRKSEEFQEQLKELRDIQKELEAADTAKIQQYKELMKNEKKAFSEEIPAPSSSEPNPAMSQNLAELYNEALQTEHSLVDTYKHVRAAELAAIRKLPMAEALALTDVAQPVRNDVDIKNLSADIHDVQGLQAQEKAIIAASGELASMVDLARRMKGLALPDPKTTVVMGDLKSQADHIEKMEKLAMQTGGARAKDLTGEMIKAETKSTESGGRGNGVASHTILKDDELSGSVFNAQNLTPVPGRTIGADMQATVPGRKGDWMFVDSWYLIGPWPNPHRKNLNKKYPPETVVDLNATYTGGRRDERPIPVSWQFFQAPAIAPAPRGETTERTGQIIPPGLGEYEIYYAYTELWFDEARDLWVAIGSDDQSKIWINDEMIWKSSDDLKSWVPNEGLRKVHFRQGVNRILYRYENGHFSGCFSFWISLKSSAQAPLKKTGTAWH